jgi:hypothetical protein
VYDEKIPPLSLIQQQLSYLPYIGRGEIEGIYIVNGYGRGGKRE